jgi:prostatic aicd phosphatase
LLLVRIPCPRYHEELERVHSETDIKDMLDSNAELFEKLSQLSGLSIKNPEDVSSLYTTLKAEVFEKLLRAHSKSGTNLYN